MSKFKTRVNLSDENYVQTTGSTLTLSGTTIFVGGITLGKLSVGVGNIATGITTVALGESNYAKGYASVAQGLSTLSSGNYSHSQGQYVESRGLASHAGGRGVSSKKVLALGTSSFNHSSNSIIQGIDHGSLGDYSAILGGRNHNISSGNTGAAIIGGESIKLSGESYVNTVAVNSLAIFDTPSSGAGQDLLTWNPVTRKVSKIAQNEINVSGGSGGGGTITGGTNGLNVQGKNIRLGGRLTGNTTIGLSSNNLIFTGSTGTLRYGSDLSAQYTSRSLIDKGYFTGNTYVVIDSESTVTGGYPLRLNREFKGQGQITLTNGSSSINGIGTNFLNSTIAGMSYWAEAWVKDSANNWFRLVVTSITNNTTATISQCWNKNVIINGGESHTFVWNGVSGTYDFYFAKAWADGDMALAFGNSSYAGGFSLAYGTYSSAQNGSISFGRMSKALGSNSFAIGSYVAATGNYSFAGGDALSVDVNNKKILASGAVSFNFSQNNSTQTGGHGALAANSSILGGINHNIPSTSLRSAIIGGNLIKVSASVLDTVHMPKVRIGLGTGGSLATSTTNINMLVRNSSTGEIEIRALSTVTGNSITSANNGLNKVDNNVRLGGNLTGVTTIGLTSHNLIFTASTGTIRYGGNYSSNFTSRSLVDKGYVTGLTTQLSSNINGTINYIPKFNTSSSVINSLIYDNGTNVGIGTTSPAFGFHLIGSNVVGIDRYTDTATQGSGFGARRSRGTSISPLTVADGDEIGKFAMSGWDGSGFRNSCSFGTVVNGAVTTAVIKQDFVIASRSDGAGGVVFTTDEKFRVQHDGKIKINITPENDNTITQILGRDSSTGFIKYRNVSTLQSVEILSISGNTTLTETDQIILVDSNVTNITITLPVGLTANKIFEIKDLGNGFNNNTTINGNGKLIDGQSSAIIDTDYGKYKLVFSISKDAWYTL